jgi:hypothetical protein
MTLRFLQIGKLGTRGTMHLFKFGISPTTGVLERRSAIGIQGSTGRFVEHEKCPGLVPYPLFSLNLNTLSDWLVVQLVMAWFKGQGNHDPRRRNRRGAPNIRGFVLVTTFIIASTLI